MNFDALRKLSSRLTYVALAIVTSVIVGSCGGGGASAPPEQNGALTILPSAATLYAGVPYSFTITGGRRPYLLTSTEPLLLPVPDRVDGNSFSVIPRNPAIVDTGLDPNELPVRSVVITVRDTFGTTFSTPATGGLRIAQNFLTGYGVVFTATNCGSGDTNAQACSGSDSIIRLVATTNGLLLPRRAVRFCVVRGDFKFVSPETPSNVPATLLDCYDTISDDSGVATARIRVPANAPTQLATLRVIDTPSGAFVDQVFTIEQGTTVNVLTVIPNDFVFTGPRVGVCGTGSGDFIVFNGTPPYQAISSSPNLSVTPSSTGANPARFTLTASNPNVCLDNATIVVIDAVNRRATVTVSTEEGSATPPSLVVQPTTVSLNDTCGFSTSVTAVGGNGALSVNSTHPRVQATLSGNTVTITRLRPDPAPPPAFYPATAVVTITDGTTIQSVTVNNVATFCP